MIPPIHLSAMKELLESSECFQTTENRAALPKRRNALELGTELHVPEEWGLYFKDKAWYLPIALMHIVTIITALILVMICSCRDEKALSSLLPGAFVLGTGQSLDNILRKWDAKTGRVAKGGSEYSAEGRLGITTL